MATGKSVWVGNRRYARCSAAMTRKHKGLPGPSLFCPTALPASDSPHNSATHPCTAAGSTSAWSPASVWAASAGCWPTTGWWRWPTCGAVSGARKGEQQQAQPCCTGLPRSAHIAPTTRSSCLRMLARWRVWHRVARRGQRAQQAGGLHPAVLLYEHTHSHALV